MKADREIVVLCVFLHSGLTGVLLVLYVLFEEGELDEILVHILNIFMSSVSHSA